MTVSRLNVIHQPGRWRWFLRPRLPGPECFQGLPGVLAFVDGQPALEVMPLADVYHVGQPIVVRGWSLRHWQLALGESPTWFDLSYEPGRESCACPARTWKPGEPCKHWVALYAALQAVGLPAWTQPPNWRSAADLARNDPEEFRRLSALIADDGLPADYMD